MQIIGYSRRGNIYDIVGDSKNTFAFYAPREYDALFSTVSAVVFLHVSIFGNITWMNGLLE